MVNERVLGRPCVLHAGVHWQLEGVQHSSGPASRWLLPYDVTTYLRHKHRAFKQYRCNHAGLRSNEQVI